MAKQEFVPRDSIDLPELTEMVVKELYGQGAITDVEGFGYSGKETSFEVDGETHRQRPRYVIRDGKKISAKDDARNWADAREVIRVALSNGDLMALVHDDAVPRSYWEDDTPASVTVHRGTLTNPPDSAFNGLPVRVEREAAQRWVKTLRTENASGSPKNKLPPKEGRQAGEPKPSTLAGWKQSNDMVERSRELLGNECTNIRAAEHAALDSGKDAEALVRDRRRDIAHQEAAKRQK